MIENRPALDVIAIHDSPETLFYVDPPYVFGTRDRRNAGAYRHEMSDEDHVALLERLKDAQGMVLLSGYPHPLYEQHLSSWERREKKARISGGRGTAIRTECIWIKPACQRARQSVQLTMDLARA